ncbi:MAG: hypothetical protein JSV00_06690 [bacterium]|nr:MAG: hypothetical protein JSV00_06690 [bacterium]
MEKRVISSIPSMLLALLLVAAAHGPALATGYDDDSSGILLYYIEGTGAYFLPDPGGDIFFHLGQWYRSEDGSWAVSGSLSGPWRDAAGSVPRVLVDLPPDFRSTHRLGLVPYGYVVGRSRDDDYGLRYYSGRYYEDYEGRGYRRQWHPQGGFWFFVAPHFLDDDRDDDRDDRRRRRRGRR